MVVQYTVGDTREVIKGIADGSVDLVATSPPFLALRSYVPADHESKGDEIGSERNPAEFIDMLLGLTAEWGRVLAAHGSIAIELGDTYSGAGGYGKPDSPNPAYGQASFEARWEGRTAKRFKRKDDGWPEYKSLALIPQLYAVALAYGINPLTGQPSPAGRWLVRNVIVWHRPNPAVGALGDKVRPSTSYIVIATRSPKRWFDLTAVRTPPKAPPQRFFSHGYDRGGNGATNDRPPVLEPGNRCDPAGAPPLDAWFDEHDSEMAADRLAELDARIGEVNAALDLFEAHAEAAYDFADFWSAVAEAIDRQTPSKYSIPPCDPYDGTHDTWTLTTQPSSLAHYAMWPAKLAERLVLMMCPREVCRVCGEPRRRMETATPMLDGIPLLKAVDASARDREGGAAHGFNHNRLSTAISTVGWTDCRCMNVTSDGLSISDASTYRPGLTLDPFAGSGTTLAVADLHGRDAIGIDFDQRNHDLYPARYDEVKRSLYGTPLPDRNQMELAL